MKMMKRLVFMLVTFITVTSSAQTGRFVGSYKNTEPGMSQQLTLFKNLRFDWQVILPNYILDVRGAWQLKNEKVYFTPDKKDTAYYSVYARYNPEYIRGKTTFSFHKSLKDEAGVYIGANYNAAFLEPVYKTHANEIWSQKEMFLKSTDKLWLTTNSEQNQVREYLLNNKEFNEYYIVPSMDNSISAHFIAHKLAEAYLQNDLIISPKYKDIFHTTSSTESAKQSKKTDGVNSKDLFRRISTMPPEEDLGNPYSWESTDISGESYQYIKQNKQFEDRTISPQLFLLKSGMVSPNPYVGPAKYAGNFNGQAGSTIRTMTFKPGLDPDDANVFGMKTLVNNGDSADDLYGSYQLKNDTAYLTSSGSFDEISVFGQNVEKLDPGHFHLIFFGLKKDQILFKSGKNYLSAGDFRSLTDSSRLNDSTFKTTILKSDTLWIAYLGQEKHVYAYAFKDSMFENSNEILVEPNGTYTGKMLVEYPVYVNEQGEFQMSDIKDLVMRRSPYLKTDDVGIDDTVSYNVFNNYGEKDYVSIPRSSIFLLKTK